MTAIERLQELVNAYNEAHQALVEQVKTSFGDITKELFEKYPGIESFGWTQYTPYFNDGDECVFRVVNYSDSIYINERRYWDWEDEDPSGWKPEWESFPGEVSNVLSTIPKNIFKEMFGDHALVTINRDGNVSIDEYSHD